jgi:hydrogenase maturation protease
VLARLAARGVPAGVELLEAREATALVEWIQHPGPVAIVDAVLADPPGRVAILSEEELARSPLTPLSSHGISAGGAIALARTLAPAQVSSRVTVVAVTIAAPGRYGVGLSPAVAAAVDAAADAALDAVRR